MMSPDSVLSLEAEEEAGGEVFQVIHAHLHFFLIIAEYYTAPYDLQPSMLQAPGLLGI